MTYPSNIYRIVNNSPYADNGICHRANREIQEKKLKWLRELCG